jgi:hypothetical protein
MLAVVASLLMMVNLDNVDLSGPDEPRYAEVAREMVERNDYLVLHFNGADYADKPPLYFWLIAAFSRLSGGVNEVAARMPSALAGVGTALLAFGLARRMFGARTAFLGGMALLGSVFFVAHGRVVRMDMCQAFLAVAMMTVFWSAHERGRAEWWTWPVFFFLGALAIMMKGPGGFLPLLIACALFSLLRRDWRAWNRSIWAGAAILVVILGAWLAELWLRGGPEFVWNSVVTQNLGRLRGQGGHVAPFYYYAKKFPEVFLPWSLLFVAACAAALRRAWRRELPENVLFMALWFGAFFVFFSVVNSKRSLYLVPVFPPAAILVAWFVNLLIAGKATRRAEGAARWLMAAPLMVVAAGSVALLILLAWGEVKGDAKMERMFEALRRGYAPVVILCAALCAQGLAGAMAALRKQWAGAMAATALMCLSLAAFAFFVFYPLTNGLTSPKKFCVEANRIVGDSELTGYGDVPNGVVYYSHHRVRLFGRPEDVAEYLGGGSGEGRFCVTPRENLDQIRDACGESVMLTVACEEMFDVSDMMLLEGRRAADVDEP